jgi:hypothetical protein
LKPNSRIDLVDALGDLKIILVREQAPPVLNVCRIIGTGRGDGRRAGRSYAAANNYSTWAAASRYEIEI